MGSASGPIALTLVPEFNISNTHSINRWNRAMLKIQFQELLAGPLALLLTLIYSSQYITFKVGFSSNCGAFSFLLLKSEWNLPD